MGNTVQEIAQRLRGTVEGDGTTEIMGLAGLRDARPGDLSFVVAEARFLDEVEASKATVLLVGPDHPVDDLRTLIRVENPEESMEALVEFLRPPSQEGASGIHEGAHVSASAEVAPDASIFPSAVVGDNARVGSGSMIHSGVVLGKSSSVGSDCVIHPNVVVGDRVEIGDRVTIYGGCVLGADGFGYRAGASGPVKLRHVGTVVIEDDVEMGASVMVDRARFGRTVVGAGTKIDNLVQVAHNVQIGRCCLIAAQVGIAGSAVLGDGVVVGGQGAVGPHVRLGDGVVVAGQSGVTKDAPAGSVLYGTPAAEHIKKKREEASVRHLPDAIHKLKELEDRIGGLEGGRE